jgi:hypothetical protein
MRNRHIDITIASITMENLKQPREMNAVSTKVVLRFFPPICPLAPFFSPCHARHVLGPCYACFEHVGGIEVYVTY